MAIASEQMRMTNLFQWSIILKPIAFPLFYNDSEETQCLFKPMKITCFACFHLLKNMKSQAAIVSWRSCSVQIKAKVKSNPKCTS